MNFDTSQLKAINRARTGQDLMITGGAGTGKTTIIKQIADSFSGKCTILAPTGKAAARLKEATGCFAQTVHRYLSWDGTKFLKIPRESNTVIVDEASMLDSFLFAHLLKTNSPQIILVGDANQLPPVGRGQPFHDLLRLREDKVARLEHCWRANAAVHKAANTICAGDIPESVDRSGGETWRTIISPNPERTEDTICGWVDKGLLDFSQDIILASKYGTGDDEGNIHSLNKRIQQIVNPHDDGERWKRGDRVIVNKNFGPDDLWNGDLGTVTDVDIDGKPWVELDRPRADGQILLSTAMQKETSLAYCLSVHKAQGSQFRRVIFVCLRQHRFMLCRSLIYTAVTRTKESCCVIGDMNAFRAGIKQVYKKKTVLQVLGEEI